MGATKKEHFTDKENALATTLKAMGHPARIAILEFLIKQDTCVCGDIVDQLPLAQATVSQHLKELKEAGLIKGTIDGTAVCYCIDKRAVKRIFDYMQGLLDRLNRPSAECC